MHGLVHAHFFAAGYLFAWVIAGPDPAPRRPSVPIRLVVLGFAIAAHAVLSQLLYAGIFVQLPVPAAERQAAGELMYYGGDIAELLLALALVTHLASETARAPSADRRRSLPPHVSPCGCGEDTPFSHGGVSMASRTNRATSTRPLICTAALAVAGTFLLVGVLGFIPGITTDYDTMTFAGHHSEAKLLGIFEVSILHNIVHLLFGAAGIALARTASGARTYLVGGGIVYLVLWLYGLLIDPDSDANFVPFNTADNWLHFVLAVGMIGLGVLLGRRMVTR